RRSCARALTRRSARPAFSISRSASRRPRPGTLFHHTRMTQRGRKRFRRSRGSVRRKVLVALGVLVAAAAIPVVGVGIWVLSVRADTPPLDQLKPVREGSNSVVYAADGSRLGYIQSDTIRHPVSASRIPRILDNATVRSEEHTSELQSRS